MSVPAHDRALFRLDDDHHLRLLEAADAEELHALIEANREELARWLPWAADQTFGGTRDFVRRTEAQVAGNDGFQTAIVCREKIAGVIGFLSVDWGNRSTSIGYWLAAEHQGKGVMTAAVRALTEHAITAWELNRVEIRAAPDNARSRAIPERLGFREEGILRAAERVQGRYLDNVVYSMLAEDWIGSR
jgi:ribosomal-protein-serine acetyltransferase